MGEFGVRGIQPLISISRINGDKMIPVISVNNSEIDGLASLSVSAYFLQLICTNGMVAKTEVSASYSNAKLNTPPCDMNWVNA